MPAILSQAQKQINYEFKGQFEFVDEEGDDHLDTVKFSGASRESLYDACMAKTFGEIYSITIHNTDRTRKWYPLGISLWTQERACAIAALNANLLKTNFRDADLLLRGISDAGAPFHILEHRRSKLRPILLNLAPKLFDLNRNFTITLNGEAYLTGQRLNQEQLKLLLLLNVSHPKTERDEGREHILRGTLRGLPFYTKVEPSSRIKRYFVEFCRGLPIESSFTVVLHLGTDLETSFNASSFDTFFNSLMFSIHNVDSGKRYYIHGNIEYNLTFQFSEASRPQLKRRLQELVQHARSQHERIDVVYTFKEKHYRVRGYYSDDEMLEILSNKIRER